MPGGYCFNNQGGSAAAISNFISQPIQSKGDPYRFGRRLMSVLADATALRSSLLLGEANEIGLGDSRRWDQSGLS